MRRLDCARLGAALLTVLAVGCGEPAHRVAVNLAGSTTPALDPFQAAVGLSKVRVVLDGPSANQRAIADLGPDSTGAVFEGFPTVDDARLTAVGLDALGNIVAFARRDGVSVAEDLDLQLPLRRNLAYVTHRPNPDQDQPGSVIYQIDLNTRGYVSKVRLPGTSPVARSITARGGKELLITVVDSGQASVVILSADDHSTRAIPLPRVQQVTLGVEGSPNGVVVGGDTVTFVDLDAGTVTEQFSMPVGGNVLDAVIAADARRALVVIDQAPGLLQIDLERRTVDAVTLLAEPGGVALGPDGRVAYVTSKADGKVSAIDLETLQGREFGSFVRGVGAATFADDLEVVLALDLPDDNGTGRVLGFVVPSAQALGVDEGVRTLNHPTGIASDGSGRRAVVVAAGTSTQTAGITVIEASDSNIEGASALYPADPDDRFQDGPIDVGQRYQPSDVAVLYGR